MDTSAANEAIETDTAIAPEPPGEIAKRADALLERGDVVRARRMVEQALADQGPQSALLISLADASFRENEFERAIDSLQQAVELDPSDPMTISRRIRLLDRFLLDRLAIRAIEEVPEAARGQAQVRQACGDFFFVWGYPGHAAGYYGAAAGLTFTGRRRRLLARVTTAGSSRFRQRCWNWEEKHVLEPLRQPLIRWENLDRDTGLSGSDLIRLRGRLEWFTQVLRNHDEYQAAFLRWYRRLALAGALPVWLILWTVAASLPSEDRTTAPSAPSLASSATATGIALLTYRAAPPRKYWARTNLRHTMLVGAIVAALSAGAIEGYLHRALPATGWGYWAVYGLVAAPAVTACLIGGDLLTREVTWRRQERISQRHADLQIIDLILIVLEQLRAPGVRTPSTNVALAQTLDFAAWRMHNRLLPPDRLKSIRAAQWLRQRAAGWAYALTSLERDLVTPVSGSQQKIERLLTHELHALAAGELGLLMWRRPPPAPPRRSTWLRKISMIARTILVAGLPLAAVFAARAVLHPDAHVLYWPQIATGIWALLYLLLNLDPELGPKINTFRGIVTTRDPGSTGGASGTQ